MHSNQIILGHVNMIIKKSILILMALVMAVSVYGLVPQKTDQVSAASSLASATIPSKYKTGYDVYRCIDISAWQGEVSVAQFKKIKALGVNRVIVRVGYTNLKLFWKNSDQYYKKNIENAYQAGMQVGAYYFSQAKTVSEAKKEAKYTVKLLKPYQSKISLPVVFDWEFGGRLSASVAKKNGKTYNTSICSAYCKLIQDAGYHPMVYANLSTLNTYLSANLYKSWDIWLAQYSKTCSYKYPIAMWQYTSSGTLKDKSTGANILSSKVEQRVDMNYMFVKQTGGKWVKQSNGKYKFKRNGAYLKSQWVTVKGKNYYLDKNGYRTTGYHKIGNFYYGFSSSGVMYSDQTATIGGKTYKFLKNGKSVLFRAKVVNVSDGLAYRTGPAATSQYTTMGIYDLGKVLNVTRVSGDWVRAGNGYWSCSKEGKKTYLKTTTVYPK